MMDKQIDTDVLINGAGPTGLMLACLLAMHKVRFRIIDKKSERESYSGAMILHSRTMEAFHQMGISRRFLREGVIARSVNFQFNKGAHFGLHIADFGNGWSLFPYIFILEQTKTEKILRTFLSEQGYTIEDGTALLSFNQKKGVVTSVLRNAEGAGEVVNARFLIGAEGSASLVRRQLRIPFYGITHPELLFVSDSQADLPDLKAEMMFSFSGSHTLGFFPLPENRWRIDGLIPGVDKQTERLGFEFIRNYFNEKLNLTLFSSSWFSAFRSHSRLAPAFRHHHCFLAGDSAHVNTPVGAQGMNAGLQDAFNLAWKLAFYLQGKATAKILDSYQEERMEVAGKTIRITDMFYRSITSQATLAVFFRLYVLPVLLRVFLFIVNRSKRVRKKLFFGISGIGISYKNSPLTAFFPEKRLFSQAPLPGERLPNFQYFVGQHIYNFQEKIRYTVFNLLIFGVRELPADMKNVADKYSQLITVEIIPEDPGTEDVYAHMVTYNYACYLVRPDMYIAWKSDSLEAKGLEKYLSRFLIPVNELQEA